tara:strand:+ start:1870 stop:2085 length:216 start_codon:yes stop_codon:yes gene_type:complete
VDKINKGDLVIVIEPLPNWSWLKYHTGDLGFVLDLRDYEYGFRVTTVYFFRTGEFEKVPDHFLSRIDNGNR